MDPRAEALYHESNEYIGGDHPISRITRVEAEAVVEALDRDSPAWDEALFVQDHVAAPDFGLDGLSLNPQVLLDIFAPAVIAMYPNRSRLRQESTAAAPAPAIAAVKSQRRHRPKAGTAPLATGPRRLLDGIKGVFGRLLKK